MTIQADAATLLRSGRACSGVRHTPTNTSWREGCRHPGAVAAHEEWKAVRRPDSNRPPAVDAAGNCIATKHGSARAYQQAGCRCQRAIERWEHNLARRADAKRTRRSRENAAQFNRDRARILRRTGGRLRDDPRKPWRGGRMAVDRNNLWMLIHGVVDSPTMGEKLAAAIRLSSVLTSEAWYRKARPMSAAEIAERIGTSDATASRLMHENWPRLIAERHLRRLADVQWKAAIVAEAPAREQRSRAQHTGPTRAGRRALAWKQHCRTMRRLRESQERAKRVALVMQR